MPAVQWERFRNTHTHMQFGRFLDGAWRCVYSAVLPPSARRDLPSPTCHIFNRIQVFILSGNLLNCNSGNWGSAGGRVRVVRLGVRSRV